jgi:hypothetical protein
MGGKPREASEECGFRVVFFDIGISPWAAGSGRISCGRYISVISFSLSLSLSSTPFLVVVVVVVWRMKKCVEA